eukprot:6890024-Pyramimonas_sp.AAC.1
MSGGGPAASGGRSERERKPTEVYSPPPEASGTPRKAAVAGVKRPRDDAAPAEVPPLLRVRSAPY